jgi:hypothetical protein
LLAPLIIITSFVFGLSMLISYFTI